MARNSGSPILFVLVASVVIIVILVVGGLLLWPLYNVYKYFQARRGVSNFGNRLPTTVDFDSAVTEDDKQQLLEYVHAVQEGEKASKLLSAQINSLGPLNRNKDGKLSQRSNNGKEGYRLEEELGRYKSEIGSLRGYINNIRSKPKDVWLFWINKASQLRANKMALISMLVLFPALFMLVGIVEDKDFIYAAKLYAYSAFVLPTQIIGEVTGLFLIEPADLKAFADPFAGSFDFQTWATIMLPVPLVSYSVYKIVLAIAPAYLVEKVPEPGLYAEKSF